MIQMPETMIKIKVERLEEGDYLATSETLQGLIAQGRTIAETLEIAQDVAKKKTFGLSKDLIQFLMKEKRKK